MNLNISGQSAKGQIQERTNSQQESSQTIELLRQSDHKKNKTQHNAQSLKPLQMSQIRPIDSDYSIQSTVDLIMKKIQLLQYKQKSFLYLSQQFKSIIVEHIGFKQILPFSKDYIGKKLIQDGLFHELWGIICRKVYKRQQMQNYYQQYYYLLTKNHSNFQRFYNNIDSSKEQSKEAENDTSTNLFPIKKTANAFYDSQVTQKPKANHQSLRKAPSLFDHIQTNQRRLKAQMVCYYLKITSFYNLIDLNINSIFEFYQQNNKQLLILSAQAPQFSESLGREVIDYREKILIAMYGYISLRQLLRIKTQYSKIDGFILYDELHNLHLWLKNNGYKDCI